jgi:hypothetical protein
MSQNRRNETVIKSRNFCGIPPAFFPQKFTRFFFVPFSDTVLVPSGLFNFVKENDVVLPVPGGTALGCGGISFLAETS